MSITTVSRTLILFVGMCSTMFAWQADRLSIDGRWTNYWIITCNDGYMHGGNYGSDGPSFSEGQNLCAGHGGISVKPTAGGPVIYQVITGQAMNFDLLLSDLVDSGAVNPTGATRLTNSARSTPRNASTNGSVSRMSLRSNLHGSREPTVWAKTNVGLTPLSSGASADAITLKATGIDLPEPRDFPNWAIAAVAACLLALIVALVKRKKA